MSPRPLPSPSAPFEACIAVSRARSVIAEAVEDLRRVAGRSAAPPGAARRRGRGAGRASARLAQAAGDLIHATAALEEARRLAPTFADVHYRLALARLQAQQRAERAPQSAGGPAHQSALRGRACGAGVARRARRYAGRGARYLATAGRRAQGRGAATLPSRARESRARRTGRAPASSSARRSSSTQAGVQSVVEDFHAQHAARRPRGAAPRVRLALAELPGYADLHHLLGHRRARGRASRRRRCFVVGPSARAASGFPHGPRPARARARGARRSGPGRGAGRDGARGRSRAPPRDRAGRALASTPIGVQSGPERRPAKRP